MVCVIPPTEGVNALLVNYLVSAIGFFPAYYFAYEVIRVMSLYHNSVNTKELSELTLSCAMLVPVQMHISTIANKLSQVSNQPTSSNRQESSIKILDETWGPYEFYREKKKGAVKSKAEKVEENKQTNTPSKKKSSVVNVSYIALPNSKIARVDDDTEYACERLYKLIQ